MTPYLLPELTYGLVRFYLSHDTVCVWCERSILVHVSEWRDGFRWQLSAGDCHNPRPEEY